MLSPRTRRCAGLPRFVEREFRQEGRANVNGRNRRNLTADAALQNDIATEQRDMNDGLSALKIYPVLSIGISYTFSGSGTHHRCLAAVAMTVCSQ